MKWHGDGRTIVGCLRHPTDSPSWKSFDHQYPEFSKESRNIRLRLAFNGFNPFKNTSVSQSTWPVEFIPYNLPSWMCMKLPYFTLSLLKSGPFSLGNNLDVYLQPLIAELIELWDVSLKTYDASTNQNYQMRVVLT
jgi:hypothetical protein